MVVCSAFVGAAVLQRNEVPTKAPLSGPDADSVLITNATTLGVGASSAAPGSNEIKDGLAGNILLINPAVVLGRRARKALTRYGYRVRTTASLGDAPQAEATLSRHTLKFHGDAPLLGIALVPTHAFAVRETGATNANASSQCSRTRVHRGVA